jgi:hypothetical protein
MPISMVFPGKRSALITIRSVDPELNDRLGRFIADHLQANNERRRRPRSLLRRLRDALTPDVYYDVDGACFRYETGDFKPDPFGLEDAHPDDGSDRRQIQKSASEKP